MHFVRIKLVQVIVSKKEINFIKKIFVSRDSLYQEKNRLNISEKICQIDY